jgi:hypothetical protein
VQKGVCSRSLPIHMLANTHENMGGGHVFSGTRQSVLYYGQG